MREPNYHMVLKCKEFELDEFSDEEICYLTIISDNSQLNKIEKGDIVSMCGTKKFVCISKRRKNRRRSKRLNVRTVFTLSPLIKKFNTPIFDNNHIYFPEKKMSIIDPITGEINLKYYQSITIEEDYFM